LSYPAHTWCW